MSVPATTRRVLDDAGGFSAMTWVMTIMLFLTLLAAAGGLGLRSATVALDRQLEGRLTVQVIDGNAVRREATAAKASAVLRRLPGVARVERVPAVDLARLVRPWLGSDADDPDLPMPAMIDVDLTRTDATTTVSTALARVSPTIRVDRHESWMSPVSGFMTSLSWLAAALVLLMLAATTAVVTLAARAGLESHRATIEVMHMLGSTDVQVARLFQRRIALDAALGGGVGGVAALATLAFIGWRLTALDSQLLTGIRLGIVDWLALALVPLAFVGLATVAARATVIGALRRTL